MCCEIAPAFPSNFAKARILMGQNPKGYCHLLAEISISRNECIQLTGEVKMSGEVKGNAFTFSNQTFS